MRIATRRGLGTEQATLSSCLPRPLGGATIPASLQGQVFYQPSLEGLKGNGTQVARRREAQMEALVDGVGVAPAEVLTTGPTGRA